MIGAPGGLFEQGITEKTEEGEADLPNHALAGDLRFLRYLLFKTQNKHP
jgi:hypothetical protein